LATTARFAASISASRSSSLSDIKASLPDGAALTWPGASPEGLRAVYERLGTSMTIM